VIQKEIDATVEDKKTKIREFLSKFIRKNELDDDTDIFAAGFVNSLFAMQLVLFVESQFGIRVERQDLKLDNFRSINALANLVERKAALK
jgi:methoxymalonate biosynthesis acyl carrier protein